MAPELSTTIVTEADLFKQAAIGIALGAVVFVTGKQLLGAFTKIAGLVATLAIAQLLFVNNQGLLSVLETGKTLLGASNNQQFICELYTKSGKSEDLLCGSGFKGTLLAD